MLFVCVENSCRSQMAEGLARHFFGNKIEGFLVYTHLTLL